MKPTEYVFLALILLVSCSNGEQTSSEVEVDEEEISANLQELTADLGVEIDTVSIQRDTIAEVEREVKPAASEAKKPEWMADSPFHSLSACLDWDGNSQRISGECCSSVIVMYKKLVASPGEKDLANLTTQDPYVGACRKFNKDFTALIDAIENAEEENDEVPF